LWYFLRNRQLAGFKFRRQIPIGPYVADFVCVEAQLIVELDGGQHAEQVQRDQARTRYLVALGFRVLRFWNNDVLAQTESVLIMIVEALRSPGPSP
jgi:very-short-patch-repair endonuclease